MPEAGRKWASALHSEAIVVDIVSSAGCDDGQQWRRKAVATGTLMGLRGLRLSE